MSKLKCSGEIQDFPYLSVFFKELISLTAVVSFSARCQGKYGYIR